LNLLGKREPETYGNTAFEEYFKQLERAFPEITLEYFQSNHEGEIVDKLHEIGFQYDGIILNAAAYTHTSIAIADAVRAISTPVVEIHISNIFQRESFRHTSFLSPVVKGIVSGFGMDSYKLALYSFLNA
ncbi:MAG TPA: type II 3-dehydroquinate dehydratase, partial [Flavobacterium sp.]|nr:type II 3-dehydroquinate dehydratase [Flavobacterium sp.]